MTVQIIAAVVMTGWGLAAAWVHHAIEHAPEGYEDEDGFHYGTEPGADPSELPDWAPPNARRET